MEIAGSEHLVEQRAWQRLAAFRMRAHVLQHLPARNHRHEQVEDEEDEHLYHTKGWSRELWIESLGMKAVIPPPEEVKKVETAIGAARAEQARGQML